MLLLPKSKVLRINSCHYGVIFTASMNSLLPKSSITATAHTRSHSFHSCSSSSSQNPIFHLRSGNNRVHFATPKFVPSIYQKVSGCSSSLTPAMPIPRPINGVDFVVPDPQIGDQNQLVQLRRKLQMNGIDIHTPGQYNALLCPRCKGGDSGEKSFSLMISKDGGLAAWNCFRGKCGWKGQINASADVKSTYASMNKVIKTKQPPRIIAEESLELEPLGDEVLKYFAERLISSETLQRNAVRQKKIVGQITIAFTYRRNGNLVNCKYRDLSKTFWEDADAEKIFYGMDDIQEASDIIIVEDEIDKLSIEEVGFRNCVSVPDGAPSKVLNKEFPLEEEVFAQLHLKSSSLPLLHL